jgi:hypothetical protein
VDADIHEVVRPGVLLCFGAPLRPVLGELRELDGLRPRRLCGRVEDRGVGLVVPADAGDIAPGPFVAGARDGVPEVLGRGEVVEALALALAVPAAAFAPADAVGEMDAIPSR